MQVRHYRSTDYSTIALWWEGHRDWAVIPEVLLPETGLVVDDGDLLCAGFLYIDSTSPVCMMEWVVANPKNPARKSLKALRMLLAGFEEWADSENLVLFTTLRQPKLSGLYERHGFVVGDTDMINMTRLGKWA